MLVEFILEVMLFEISDNFGVNRQNLHFKNRNYSLKYGDRASPFSKLFRNLELYFLVFLNSPIIFEALFLGGEEKKEISKNRAICS